MPDDAPMRNQQLEVLSPEPRGYYHLPVLKRPVWRWEVWSYFFLGGLSAGAFSIASLAYWFGGSSGRIISRLGYIISAVALVFCPPLLIRDLGRPGRFLNMLRIIKPQSPMSLGSWAIVAFSGCVFPLAIKHLFPSRRSAIGRIVEIVPEGPLAAVGSLLGCFVGGYTGVLLSTTSVPLWSRSRFLGPMFLASAFSSGLSAIIVGLIVGRQATPKLLAAMERFETLVVGAEIIALVGFFREASWATKPLLNPREHARAFVAGALGLGVAVPAIASIGAASRSPRWLVLSSACTLAGGVFLRYSIVASGRASADDPEATFRHTTSSGDRSGVH